MSRNNLQEDFNLNVKEMSTTCAANELLCNNPKQRAEDLNQAFADPNIKGGNQPESETTNPKAKESPNHLP